MIEARDYGGAVTRYDYDLAGRLIRTRKPNGTQLAYDYDDRDRLIEKTVTPKESEPSQTTYAYDGAGRLIEAQNAHSLIQLQRDPLGRVTQETHNGHILKSRYDADGHRASLESERLSQQWRYGPEQHLQRLTLNDHSPLHFEYTYRGQEKYRYSDQGFGLLQQYDPQGRLWEQQAGVKIPELPGHPPHGSELSRRYHYDPAGRLERLKEGRWGQTRYHYDPSDRFGIFRGALAIYPSRSPVFRYPKRIGNLMHPAALRDIVLDGLWRNNPGLVQLLGLCPLLAVSTTAINGLALGIATTLTLAASNLMVSLLRGWVRNEIRIPVFVLVIAAIVTAIELAMSAWFYDLYLVLGIFIPLIVTNCSIIGRAEAFASRNSVLPSGVDGLANGLGFTAVLFVLGSIREIVGAGTWLQDAHLMFGAAARSVEWVLWEDYRGFLLAVLPPGAFIGLGVLIAAKQWLGLRRARQRVYFVATTRAA